MFQESTEHACFGIGYILLGNSEMSLGNNSSLHLGGASRERVKCNIIKLI
jgi:hypothetical protein